MINSFKELGEKALEGLSPSERKKKFLLTQTIVPNEPKSNDKNSNKYKEIIINLDTEKEEIEIKLGKELWEENREDFFGFELQSGNSSKTFFTSNRWYYHLLTIPHLIYYIEKEFNQDKYNKFLTYLKKIESVFYVSERSDKPTKRPSKSYLKMSKFVPNQKGKLLNFLEEDLEKAEKKNKKKKISKLINLKEEQPVKSKNIQNYLKKLISEKLGVPQKFINNYKRYLNIFSLKINNQYILNTEFKDDYINVIHYILQQRFFDKTESKVQDEALCSTCNQIKLVTGKVDIPTKFYITSRPYFFENKNENNAYKSFAICSNCYQKIRVGIGEIENNYFSQLFGRLNYYLIPQDINNNINHQKEIRKINRILSRKRDSYKEDFKLLKRVKKRNVKVDFLFWYMDQRSFIVLDSINDVYYSELEKLFNQLNDLNNHPLYNKYLKYKPEFNSIYWLLFPNKHSHNKADPEIYRKELINLFKSLIKGRKINYHYLINKFNFIFKKKYLNSKKKIDIIDAIRMNILLSWFNRVAKLKGGFTMKEGQSVIEIQNKDIKEFFEVHSDIYEGNSYRQGLFMLGVLMNQVLKEQKDKSSTILDKLNFDGLPVRRVKTFIIDITEILKIYRTNTGNGKQSLFKLYQLLHAQMIDRLQGIETSSLNKDEVIFYILSGISFGRYLGYKYNQENKKNEG
ncbi:TM1802 family CRISPR-associated protein [Halonatronum saccharophilum]|uniref:TM1802 family CRISPR-associated protein n=1 Tax=Halonatronum saccharophilum TaxID=150060 RepID=UPI000488EB98|nr:TM1802 family CRISPR-associated protein [Halonatronum saccharophilum]